MSAAPSLSFLEPAPVGVVPADSGPELSSVFAGDEAPSSLPPPGAALVRAILLYRRANEALASYNRDLLSTAQHRVLVDEEFQHALGLQQAADNARLEVHRLVDAQYLQPPRTIGVIRGAQR